MNIYLTSGTTDFMETLRKSNSKETMIVMNGAGNSVLLHETAGKTLFQTPRSYEVISSSGTLNEEGFFALNNIPVTDEGRPVFEHRLLSRIDKIEDEQGFIAFRLLRPADSETYIVLTEWTNQGDFKSWENSSTYKSVHESNESGAGLDKMSHLFSSAAYVTTYKTMIEDDKDKQ